LNINEILLLVLLCSKTFIIITLLLEELSVVRLAVVLSMDGKE